MPRSNHGGTLRSAGDSPLLDGHLSRSGRTDVPAPGVQNSNILTRRVSDSRTWAIAGESCRLEQEVHSPPEGACTSMGAGVLWGRQLVELQGLQADAA